MRNKLRTFFWVLMIWSAPAISFAQNWYIDNTATGANDGTSWANAWTSFARNSQINWSKVKPGDFVYISGGPTGTSQTYNGMIEPTVSGSAGNPITITVGQDPAHNGLVIIDGAYANDFTGWYGIDIDGQSYFNITGQAGTDPVPHIKITHHYGHGIYIVHNCHDMHLSYMEVTQNGYDNWPDKHVKATQPANDPVSEGLYFMVNQRNDFIGEIDHMILHDNNGDEMWVLEITGDSSAAAAFGVLKVHDNDIYNWHADGVKIGLGGTDFYNNKIHDRGLHIFDHPDGIQYWSSYVRVYNNQFYSFDVSPYIPADYEDSSGANSYMRYNPGEGGDIDHNPRYVYIYNNLFYEPTPRTRAGNQVRGIELSFHSIDDAAVQSVNHIYVVNNVFKAVAYTTIGLSLHRDVPTNVADLQIVNNIFSDCGPISLDPGYQRANTFGGTGSGASIVIDNNSFYFTDQSKWAGAIITEEGSPGNPSSSLTTIFSYTAFKALFPNAAYPGFLTPGVQSHEVVTDPQLDADFQPQAGSPVIDNGADLSSLDSVLAVDRNNIPRPQGLGWDIGAFESNAAPPDPDSGMVLHLNFEGDNFGAGVFADKSSAGNNANCQLAFGLNGTTYNQCPASTAGPDGSAAAAFQGTRCDQGSDYLAVNSNPSLDNLTQGSISVWGAFDDNSVVFEKLLDTYSGTLPDTWMLGKDSDKFLTFTANTDFGAPLDLFTFPGSYEPLHSWNHYVVTWNGNVIKGYYNGVYFGQVPQKFISKFKLGTYLAMGALNHGDVRNSPDNNCVNYYGGDPTKSYIQPNDGFMKGKLDDVRVYNRPLTQAEVSILAGMTSSPASTVVLGVSKAGAGSGRVTSSDIDCGKHCAEALNPGTAVTLSANPLEGSAFFGWSGACSGTASCALTLNSPKAVTAAFVRSYPVLATFEAEAGGPTGPFVSAGGTIYQSVLNVDPSQGGRASYNFTVTTPGNYLVSAVIDAPSEGNNSVFASIDAEPTTDNVWNMNTTGGFEEQNVSWGGFTSGGNPAHVFTLAAGSHTLIIRGREEGTYLDKIFILGPQGAAVPPSIVFQPENISVVVGTPAQFTLEASGTAPLSYQWKKNGTAIPGATSNNYTTPATALSDSGTSFTCVITNSAGSVTSTQVTLTVTAQPVAPTIILQPQPQTVAVGQTATFAVQAQGTSPLHYQWRKSGAIVAGGTSARLTTPAASGTDNGAVFDCVVTNSAGSATSNGAMLIVTGGSSNSTETSFLTFKNVFNPAKEILTLTYNLAGSGASLTMYDHSGNLVRTLTMGNGLSTWDGRNEQGSIVTSGTYVAVLKQGSKVVKKKVVAVK